jgi:hypothetical protein
MSTGLCSLSEFPEENKAILRLHVEFISLNKIDEFRAQCLALLQTGLGQLVVDLSPLARIPSGVLAAVMDTGLLAQTGETATQQVVVLAGPAVARQLRLFEHSSVLDIRQWDSEELPPSEIKLDAGGSATAGG